MKISPLRLGAVLGAIVGLSHLGWCALVAFGVAQPILNFVLRVHFLAASITVAPFDLRTATTLVAVTSLYGFALGVVMGVVWNWLCGGGLRVVENRSSVSSNI